MKLLLALNNSHRELAKKEALIVLKPRKVEDLVRGNKSFLLLDIEKEKLFSKRYEFLGLTKWVSLVNHSKEVLSNFVEFNDFYIEAEPYNRGIIDYAVKKLDFFRKARVNSRNIFKVILFENKGPLISLLLWENNSWKNRLPHLMPGLFPATIHPLIARAMVNLSDSNTILDPFMGTGGIIIEALLTNRKAIGLDIDERMIERAYKRLKYLNIKDSPNLKIIKKDFFSIKEFKDLSKHPKSKYAIVTEPPFGKNTSFNNSSLIEFYKSLLTKARDIVDKVVITFPIPFDEEIIDNGWKIDFCYSYRVHRSMKRHIYLLS